MTQKKDQKREIIYHIVNSLLAGGLVFLGSLTNGEITAKGIMFSFLAAGIVCLTQFKKYWDTQEGEYSNSNLKLFNFVG